MVAAQRPAPHDPAVAIVLIHQTIACPVCARPLGRDEDVVTDAEATHGPFSYRLGMVHEMWCRSCGEGVRGASFEAVTRWRDEHRCEAGEPPDDA